MSFVDQTRRMIEMAEAAGKPAIAGRLRDVLADAERLAVLLAEGPAN